MNITNIFQAFHQIIKKRHFRDVFMNPKPKSGFDHRVVGIGQNPTHKIKDLTEHDKIGIRQGIVNVATTFTELSKLPDEVLFKRTDKN